MILRLTLSCSDCKALLRCNLCRYQFNPELFNVDAVRLILLKAIANLPFTDLTLCKYLIQTDRVSLPID